MFFTRLFLLAVTLLIVCLPPLQFCLTATARAAEPQVVVTIKPIHALAAAVMAGVGEPKLLIEGTASPHTFALKPSDARLVNGATVFVRVSEGLEPFTTKLVRSLPKNVRVVTLQDTSGLTLHRLRDGGTFESHSSGKTHAHGHNHHAQGASDSTDGHIWLDPTNAKLMARAMADQFAAVMPRQADILRANAERLTVQLDRLDREIESELRPHTAKPYVVFHDAYQYFERRYGLSPVGSVTINPDVPPSAKRLTELRAKLKGLRAACVFAEPQFAPKVIDIIVEGTTTRRGLLDPLGATIPAGPAHYETLIRSLASGLKSCLADPS